MKKITPENPWIFRGCSDKICLLVLDELVDGLGGSLAGTHGLDDGGSAGHGIAAGIHAVTAGLAVVAVGDDAAVIVGH